MLQNGYGIRLNKILNCGGADQVIRIDQNFTIHLNSKCELIAKGCVHSTGFSTAKVRHYDILYISVMDFTQFKKKLI